MCGITGYINLIDKSIKETATILNMLRIQKHRGPDDSGVRAFSLISGKSLKLDPNEPSKIDQRFEGIIGFNRLSILDLSMNGHQPMVSPDQKVILTLNGEIYNAFDYKDKLQQWGFNFRSTTDTEIILALYLKYGFESMVSRLNGMFAIVIVDLRKREIFITRDRFGIKPLYYIFNNDIFAFSSELKSFGCIQNSCFQLNEEKLDEYMLFRNNIFGTLYKNIRTVIPGTYLSFKNESGLILKRYFNINEYSRSNEVNGIDNCINKLEKWLSQSVKSQLMSDVKLGCQLSGGIDSTLVTWLANKESQKGRFEAVSIIFNDPRFNEEQYINSVASNLSITSHKFLLEPDYYMTNLEKVTWHLEAPVNHPNTIAIYKLSQKAKEYVTVLLSGEGADEIFGGYDRFYRIKYPFHLKRVLHEAQISLRHPFNLIKYCDKEHRAVMTTAYMRPEAARILRSDFSEERALQDRKAIYHSLSGSTFDRQIKYEVLSFLPDLLIRQDKMSMAHSIENRVPFLDNNIVENSFTISEDLLLLRKSPEGNNTEKYLLKKMAAGTFGDDFAFRKKMGFGIPVREFLGNDKHRDYLYDKVLHGIKERGLFNFKTISNWIANIDRIKSYELEALWVILSFEIWASLYLDMNYENCHT